jgi:hypothetical protein
MPIRIAVGACAEAGDCNTNATQKHAASETIRIISSQQDALGYPTNLELAINLKTAQALGLTRAAAAALRRRRRYQINSAMSASGPKWTLLPSETSPTLKEIPAEASICLKTVSTAGWLRYWQPTLPVTAG